MRIADGNHASAAFAVGCCASMLDFAGLQNMKLSPAITLLFLLAPWFAIAADDMRGDSPDSPPSTPEEERAKFHLPPGFEIQLVAAEPDIQKPLNITFDAAGRLWVTGSEMYPWPAGTDAAGQPIPGYEKAFADIAS